MELGTKDFKGMVIALGFAPQDGTNGVFSKAYSRHDNYIISIDFNTSKINYGKKIKVSDLTTSNFSKAENFVVLECVDRLLEKGYAPECLELEKKYPLGRENKGKLDILVYDDKKLHPFLMIECKTWGNEFDKETTKTIKDGGQIFSYYQQDKHTKYLCLYASCLNGNKIEYKNNIIVVADNWRELSSAKDVHDHWNKNYKDNGLFDTCALPYDVKPKSLTYGMLKNLKEEDSGKIFNHIMEILRHNAISDKPNAFNKLLNLFVCKIIDENRNPDDELEFQWRETDTDESLQMRLNDLYKDGMKRFLEIDVIDHSEDEVNKALEGIDNATQKQRLMDMFRDTRLKKSPNFAFAEVLDNKTFELNAKIVREIVELLQVYKFRYAQKHEFLGNFFELLLNTSMKQEVGQYFTPVPITRFIISSLPMTETIQKNIDNRANNVLPVVIDYACGSGHFLTEYMNQLQNIIDDKLDITNATPSVKKAIQSWQGYTKFMWAKDFVYGIDLDNRLVKTTKVSAFFNGDGEANIIWASGLDNFSKTKEYRNLLKKQDPYEKKNNGQFDILISNPPYSVDAFKGTMKHGDDTFELYKHLTDNSKEIECLFVERMKQLLKIGGIAGVILPSSILSNGGIHSRAREIILKYFKVKSIVELGSATFMETGTNTVIFFLERRSDNDFMAIKRAIDNFIVNKQDVTVLGIENVFSKFVNYAYEDLAFDDYVSLLSGESNQKMKSHELYNDYFRAFGENAFSVALELEKDKILYFILTYSQNVVLVKTGKKQDEKKFLGYEFSKRRGHEGIKFLPNGTKLYDESDDKQNPLKASSYIYNAFLGREIDVNEDLVKNVSYVQMCQLIGYGTNKFDKNINLNRKVKIVSKYGSVSIGSLCQDNIVKTDSGFTFPKDFQGNKNINDIPFYKVSDMNNPNNQIVMFGSENYVTEDILKTKIKGRTFPAGAIIFPKVGMAIHTNKKRMLSVPAVCDNNVMGIWSVNEKVLLNKYLFYVFRKYINLTDIAANTNPPAINQTKLFEARIPIPPIEIQAKIVAEFVAIELKENESKEQIKKLASSMVNVFNKVQSDIKCRFEEVATLEYGSSLTKYERTKGDFPVVGSNGIDGFHNEFLVEAPCIIVGRKGSAGKVNYYEQNCYPIDTTFYVKLNKETLPKYFYYFLKSLNLQELSGKGIGTPGLNRNDVHALTINIHSVDKQKEIVAEIEKAEREIAALNIKLDEIIQQKNSILKKYL